MAEMNLTEARATLPALLDRVERGEEITITRHGRPAAVMLRPDAVRLRRAESALAESHELGERLDAARSRPLPTAAVTDDHAHEWVEAIRVDRDRT